MQSLAKLAVHPDTIPTPTVAMLLVMRLHLQYKQDILKIDYPHILWLKNYICFRKSILSVIYFFIPLFTLSLQAIK